MSPWRRGIDVPVRGWLGDWGMPRPSAGRGRRPSRRGRPRPARTVRRTVRRRPSGPESARGSERCHATTPDARSSAISVGTRRRARRVRRRCRSPSAAGEPDAAGSLGHPPHHVVHRARPEVVVVTSVSISGSPGRAGPRRTSARVVDRGDRRAGLGEGRDHLVRGALGDPVADVARRAGRRAARRPAAEANHGSSMTSGWPTRRITRSAIDLADGGDGDPVAVGGAGRCCAARCWSTGCRARARACRLLVDRRARADRGHDRLEQAAGR